MNEKNQAPKAHSEDYFGEYRDYWWNTDFLELMSRRLKFAEIQNGLDIGCGVGHWGQLLATFLPASAGMIGIDLEDGSLARAAVRAEERGLSGRYTYQKGDATILTFADNYFDFVTCQTVLIHLAEPRQALKEMLRVLKPGGLLLVAEPNNFANKAVASNLTAKLSVEDVLDRLRFDLLIERGKKELGLGFNSEGDLVPGHLAELGATDINVYLSDKASALFAPYSNPDQRANVRQITDWTSREFVGWNRDEMKSYFTAGGGDPSEFDFYWGLSLQDANEMVQAIESGSYHTGGGCLTYLVSGRKQLGN